MIYCGSACSNSDLKELKKLFIKFVNLLFSTNIFNRYRSYLTLSLISIHLPKNGAVENFLPMNLELGPMVLLAVMNISTQFMKSTYNQVNTGTSWLKSDVYIKLMWKNLLHSMKDNILNNKSKCVDVRLELIQLFLLLFHGLEIDGKYEIVTNVLQSISACSTDKNGCQPRLLSRLIIIFNYLMHHFNEQSASLHYDLLYNLVTKYFSEPTNSDICNYQYKDVQIFDQNINYIFYDVSVPYGASEKFWPGPEPSVNVI